MYMTNGSNQIDPEIVALYGYALKRDGFLILPDITWPDTVASLDKELADRFEQTPFCIGDFSGPTTKRFGALLKRSVHAQKLALHPLMLALAEEALGANCDSIQLHLTQAIEIHPGAPAQIPHRDQDMYGLGKPHVELCLNVMWPMTEFTADNGATTLWPASMNLPPMAIPGPEAAVRAAMRPGSALVFLGSTLHCAGANRTDRPRRGVAIGYSLGWLKQFENQYLVYPPEVARNFPRRLAELVGYRTQRPNLNNYEGRCPSLLLDGEPDEHLGMIDNLPKDMSALMACHAADPDAFIARAAGALTERGG